MVGNSLKKGRKNIELLLVNYYNKKVFTAASLGCSIYRDEEFIRLVHHCGKVDGDKLSAVVDDNTFFDLASLTKPLVTVLSLFALKEDGLLTLDDELHSLLSIDIPADKKAITLLQLMNHSSGLPPHKPYYEKLLHIPITQRKDKVVQWILREKMLHSPGEGEIYSDLDYMLLSAIIEEKAKDTLDNYWKKRILKPHSLEDLFCFSTVESTLKDKYAATERCPWSGKDLTGIVHDDNCRALGGVSGHAGLFGTLKGVMRLCEMLLIKYSESSFINCLGQKGKRRWYMGFDTPSRPISSSGKYFSDKSLGHLGFTGTSFWLDLEKRVSIVFLTNRVHCSKDKKMIQELRPKIHDLMMEKIISSEYSSL